MQNHDAVVSTLGPRKPFEPSSLLHDAALATTRTMQRSRVKRLLVLSAAAHFPGIFNRIVSLILRNHMRDSLSMEAVVRASGLNWTIARPPRLTDEKYSSYRSREDAAPKMGSLCPAKRLRHSCSTRSSRRNTFRKSSASRNDF